MKCIMKVSESVLVDSTPFSPSNDQSLTDCCSAFTGEGHFDDGSNKPSGAATPIEPTEAAAVKGAKKGIKGLSKKAKTAKQRLAIADAEGDLGMGG